MAAWGLEYMEGCKTDTVLRACFAVVLVERWNETDKALQKVLPGGK
jgi:hypothetical protein